jgi:hypothetical protein
MKGHRMAIDSDRVKPLFLGAIERSDPSDRRAFLDAEIGDDHELLGRLAALLAAYDNPPVAIDRPLRADPEATDASDGTPSVTRLAAGDWSAAEAQVREALAIREIEKSQHWTTAESRSLLAAVLIGEKKTAEAASLLRSGYEGMARSAAAIPAVDRPRLAEALDRLIAAGEAAGTKAELAAWKAERAKLATGGPKP